MVRMRIGAAFSESFAFLKANWVQMLIWFAGALVAVGLLGYLMIGSTFSAMMMTPGDPSVVLGAFGRIGLFALLAAVILYAVSMLIWRGGMYPGEAPHIGWAVQAGPAFAFGMTVVMIAAYIVVLIVMLVLALVFGAAGSFSPAALESGTVGGGMILVGVLFYIALVLFMLWIQARFSVAGPVMADRLTRNPVTGLSESWRLTRGSQWKIVGFYVLFTILIVAYTFVAGVVLGAVAGAVANGSAAGTAVSAILSAAVIYLPILMLSFSVPVGIYRTIAPQTSSDVFA